MVLLTMKEQVRLLLYAQETGDDTNTPALDPRLLNTRHLFLG